jgi:probable HAF family extracellular repeat protein
MFGPLDAFIWTQDQGMRALPGLPGGDPSPIAYGVNADGSVVVGSTAVNVTLPIYSHAVRWVDGVVSDLGTVPGYMRSIAYAVDDSGSVIGGQVYTGGALPTSAAVWTPATGMVLLSDYLQAHGVGIPTGYRLEEVRAISGDGLTFAGAARNLATNHAEGFVATIPAPSSILVLALPALARRRRRNRSCRTPNFELCPAIECPAFALRCPAS